MACLVLSLIIYVPALMAKDFKLGVFDIQKIARDSKAAKNAADLLMKDLQTKRATLVEKQKGLQTLKADFDNAPANTKKAKQEKLADAAKEYKRLAADLDEAHKKKTAEINQKILTDIRDVITVLAKREGYTLIMQKGNVYFSDDEYDITDKIIRAYDQKR
jgi:outer membrane protein